ncbi:hypothetical protein GY12_02025 [Micrococcus luteus]|nr:hypothetical protein GY12_02025 [Micrococcus luteus]
MGEAHRHRFRFHLIKLIRANVALHRQMMTAWLQILAQRQHGHTVATQIAHHFDDFVIGLTKADHQT